MGRMRGGAIAVAMLLLFAASPASAVAILFDYSYDTSGLFDPATATGSAARARLDDAARFFSGLLTDDLDAIAPGGPNTWTASFVNPATGGLTRWVDPVVPADSLIVFVGARNLGGHLGFGGFGGFSAFGTGRFVSQVATRGQGTTQGPFARDFGPWGGSIAFDLATSWYLGAGSPTAGSYDFLSVALHELGHVLGLGVSDSWKRQVVPSAACASGLAFGGVAASALGGSPCLAPGGAHWAEGTASWVGTRLSEAAMDPTLFRGVRKPLTELDLAGLADVGWTLAVPEPRGLLLLAIAALASRKRRA